MRVALVKSALCASEAPIARRIFFTRRPQVTAVIIGPQLILENVFSIRRLPQHEIAGPLLPRSPHEEIDIGDVWPLQVPCDRGLGDPLRIEPARSCQTSNFSCSFCDFSATTVVDTIIDGDDVVARRHVFRNGQFIDDAAP